MRAVRGSHALHAFDAGNIIPIFSENRFGIADNSANSNFMTARA